MKNSWNHLKKIVENLASEISNFKLRITETGLFPTVKNPRILWLDVQGDLDVLRQINENLETECEKIGFAKEKRTYKPHLTIGRIREPNKARGLAAKHLQNGFASVEFEVSEIIIYESKLQPTGAIYSPIQKIKLF